jgi:hypothetical protein
LWLTPKERKNLGLFFLPILTHLFIWVLFAAVDYLLYRLIFSMSKQFQNLPGLEVHLKLHREVGVPGTSHSVSKLFVSLAKIWNLLSPGSVLIHLWVTGTWHSVWHIERV